MNCPYCAQEISEDVLACSHCGRDVALFLKLLGQVARLGDRIQALETQVTQLAKPSPMQEIDSARSPLRVALFCSVVSLIVASPMLLTSPDGEANWTLLPLALAPLIFPLPFGFWLGYTQPGNRFLPLLGSGLIVGLAGAGWLLVAHHLGCETTVETTAITEPFGFIIFMLPGLFMFLFGTFTGSWLSSRRLNRTPGFAYSLASAVTQKRHNATETASSVERLAKIIASVAPILTFAASVVASVLSYLAKVK
jgi:hypothetical protein